MHIQKSKLTLKIQFSQKKITTGENADMRIKVIAKALPIAVMKFDCEIENVFYGTSQRYELALMSGKGSMFQETIPCDTSGLLKAKIQDILLFDLLGLWKTKISCQVEAQMLILPPYRRSSQIEQFCKQGMEKEKEILQRTGLQSDDSYEIKEYQEGDSLKRMHHKMTYKLQKPMIRQYANLEAASIILILDLSGDVATVEKTLMMFHSAARTFVNNGTVITCVFEQLSFQHRMELTHLPQIHSMLVSILSAPRSEAVISIKENDDIQYRIHGNEFTMIGHKEAAYENKTPAL